MKKQNMNKHYQKQNIKKEYAAARNAGSQTAGTATKSTGKKLGEKVSDKLKEFFENNRKVFIWDRRRNCPSRVARCRNQLVFDAHLYRLVGYRFLLSQRG